MVRLDWLRLDWLRLDAHHLSVHGRKRKIRFSPFIIAFYQS